MVYIAFLSAVDNIGWYITRFCLPLPWTMMIAMSPGFVYLGQYWLVYFTVVSGLDNIGWYINRFCLSWTVMVGISPWFSVAEHIC